MKNDTEIPADTYLTTERLIRDAVSLADHYSHIDGVIGIARSGMLPATAIATRLHRPLWSVHQFGTVQSVGHGTRIRGQKIAPRRLLIVDDTAYHGTAMRQVLATCKKYFPAAKIETATVYAHSHAREAIERCHAVYNGAHYLEWNFWNGPNCHGSGTDLDGILCHDPTREQDDDGPRYLDFIENARPLHLPRREPVPLIVTARHEQYRPQTEAWLKRHGVSWERLVMRPFSRPSCADWVNTISDYKAREALASGSHIFVESCPVLSRAIADRISVPVLCPAAGQVFRKGQP